MTKKKKIAFTVSMIIVLVLGSVLLFLPHSNCDLPMIFGNQRKANSIIADLVNQAGGLPKPGIDFSEGIVTPVDSWEIDEVNVGNNTPLLGSITDDDPVYSYAIDFRAFYLDGSEERLRLSSWQYGLVVCPVVITLGDGPPGNLELLH